MRSRWDGLSCRRQAAYSWAGSQCDQRSRQGNILPYGNQFVYGLILQCDVEYVLGRHWAITLEPRMTYLIKTQFDNVRLSASVGVKYYF